jgi:DNA-binding MarR family transcriptional regulator
MTNELEKPSRRSPNRAQLAVWREYIETAEALGRALASGLQSTSGVSPGDYAVLLALSEADDHRLRSSALAEVIGWERSRLSHHLGRMEARGLIRRQRSDSDNRGAAVEMTDEGAKIFRSASVSHLRLVRELFVDALTSEELEDARKVTTSLRRHLGNVPLCPQGGDDDGE